MARKPKKPQQQPEPAKSFDEFAEDAEGIDEEVVDVEPITIPAKLRDWRDVEKLKEERMLRRMVEDDLDLLDDGTGSRRRR